MELDEDDVHHDGHAIEDVVKVNCVTDVGQELQFVKLLREFNFRQI